MLASQRFLDPSLETRAPNLLGRDQTFEFLHLRGRLHECGGDATLLSLAKLLAVDDDQRSVLEFANGAARSGGANVRKASRELLHRATASGEHECGLACSMTERERDDAVVAGEVQVQFALRAPESAVTDQRA